MKKKKTIIIIIIVILLIAACFFVYKYYIDKNEEIKRQVEIEDIMANKDFYVNKEVAVSGILVRWPGFNMYYSLMTWAMIENNEYPGTGLDIEYQDGLDQYVRYEYIEEYKEIKNAPMEVYIKGVFKDRGYATDVARYYLNIIEIKELRIIN